jgi:CubicO group peptidase (beta-lactamase class C family)
MQATHRAIDALIDAQDIPSVSVAVWVNGAEHLHRTAGIARLEPRRLAVEDQVYDLASVTKIIATVPVVAHLIARGLDLDAPVRRTLPHVDPRITARHLLQHAAGYAAWAPLYEGHLGQRQPQARQAILDAACTATLIDPPGHIHRYSDLGYLTLCALLEAAGGERLDVQWQRATEWWAEGARCGLTWGWPSAAATEDCPVRGGMVEGVVHDLNCFAMGGVSSHAGLFGTARSVASAANHLLEGLLGRGPWGGILPRLGASTGPGSHRLGFDGISPGYSSTGRYFPPDTVGHLGYTGTSVWIVPSRQTVVVMLSNRVHPTDDLKAIRAARPTVHEAIAEDLGWVHDPSDDTA